jgi:ATP-dependent Clp protease adapter protein ClpS
MPSSLSGASRLTTVKLRKETADLVRVYCIFNDISMQDFVTEVLRRKLQEFGQEIEKLKQIGPDELD